MRQIAAQQWLIRSLVAGSYAHNYSALDMDKVWFIDEHLSALINLHVSRWLTYIAANNAWLICD